MKRKLITTTAVLTGLFAVTVPARADRLGFQFGVAGGNGYFSVGFDGGHGHKHHRYENHGRHRPRHYVRAGFGAPIRQIVRHSHPPVVHTCAKIPVYKDIWVEPVYRKAFDGYDACGRPRYRSVVVKPGYYRTVVSHYACHCGLTHR